MNTIRILGIDPGLQKTGWACVDWNGQSHRFVAGGLIKTNAKDDFAKRLLTLDQGLQAVLADHAPTEAAIEETFVNANPASALKLGMARGVAFIAPARAGLSVFEYGANLIKKSVCGSGHADKTQVQAMVKVLMPTATFESHDVSDACAIAICHAHHRQTKLIPE